ncbi:hypothetical protein SKAU_G00139940 [Synaphobranchus kaupii]|uniref:Uncharacterized protein n=1 Tax=Synaphobranchus kaupii TaxID=118154 RepID=A0A9Q1J456_SYNKA|nr:hypothetical protein SKAU_G00139940 [Synaphobranchus kaupii]
MLCVAILPCIAGAQLVPSFGVDQWTTCRQTWWTPRGSGRTPYFFPSPALSPKIPTPPPPVAAPRGGSDLGPVLNPAPHQALCRAVGPRTSTTELAPASRPPPPTRPARRGLLAETSPPRGTTVRRAGNSPGVSRNGAPSSTRVAPPSSSPLPSNHPFLHGSTHTWNREHSSKGPSVTPTRPHLHAKTGEFTF